MKQRPHPYAWLTWMTPILAGDQCLLQPWLQTNYFLNEPEKVSDGFNAVEYSERHAEMLRGLKAERIAQGATRTWIEDQTKFTYHSQVGLDIGAKMDLVTEEEGGFTIFDTKTGKPKDADIVQVKLEMWLGPHCLPFLNGQAPQGRVVYKNHVTEIPPTEITEEFKSRVKNLAKELVGPKPPAVPSARGCRFCKISSSVCPDRQEGETSQSGSSLEL